MITTVKNEPQSAAITLFALRSNENTIFKQFDIVMLFRISDCYLHSN